MSRRLERNNTQRKPGRKNLRRVLKYITQFWQLKMIIFFVFFVTIIENFTPAIIGSIIDIVKAVATGDAYAPEKGMAGIIFGILNPVAIWVSAAFKSSPNVAILGVFSASLILVSVSTGLLNYIQRYASSYVSQMGAYNIRRDLYNSLLEQSFSFYDQQRTGQLMSRATSDIGQIERFYNFGLRMIVSSGLTAALVIYSLLTIDVSLSLLSFTLLPFTIYTIRQFSTKIRPLWTTIREQFGDITSILQENFMGIRVVRGFAMEAYEEQKLSDQSQTYLETKIEAGKVQAFWLPISSLLTTLGSVLILWYGGRQVISGAITLGSLVAFYFYAARFSRPMRMLGFMTGSIQQALAAADRVFEIIDAKVDVSDREGAIELGEIKGKITFENVNFSYDDENMVLEEINLEAQPGKTIAILGATGSGKSSIINLIPRFYDVSKGRITIDDYDIRDLTIKSLRRNIGIVRQDPFIFSTTFKENIAFGVENVKLEDIKSAAKRAKIADFIESLPDGYETKVGERGVTVSGGQKQRLAIARAFLKNPKILFCFKNFQCFWIKTWCDNDFEEDFDQLLCCLPIHFPVKTHDSAEGRDRITFLRLSVGICQVLG